MVPLREISTLSETNTRGSRIVVLVVGVGVDREDGIRRACGHIQLEPVHPPTHPFPSVTALSQAEAALVRVESKAGDGADSLPKEAFVISDLVQFEPIEVLHRNFLVLRAARDNWRKWMDRERCHITGTGRKCLGTNNWLLAK